MPGAPTPALGRPRLDADPALLHLLQRTATDLAAALDVRDAVTAVVRTGRDVLGTSSCGVALLDDTGEQLVPAQPDRDPAADDDGLGFGVPVPLTSSTPSAEAARTRREVLLRSRDELAARFDGGLNALVLDLGEHSWAMYPMVARGRLVGVLRFGFRREGSLDDVERIVATTLAGQCALAVERVRLLAQARDATRTAVRSEQRYRTLAEAGRLDVFTGTAADGLTSDLPGWRALTGRVGDVTGDGWLRDVHPDDLPTVVDTWGEAVGGGTAARTRFRVRTPDGWRWLGLTGVPVREDPDDPDSPVLEWVGSIDDVTDRVRAGRRARSLQALTAALAVAGTYPEVLDAVLSACLRGFAAARGTLALVEPQLGTDSAEGPSITVHRLLRNGVRRTGEFTGRSAADHLEQVSRLAGSGGEFLTAADVPTVDPAVRPLFESAVALGEVAWAVLPLTSRHRPLGTLTLGFTDPLPPPGPDLAEEQEFLLTFARQAAGALERMQLLEVERSTATVLAEALRPGPLPEVPWLSAHRSTTTSAGSEVGGDWAELIPLSGDRVAVVLGDVMGRGARAATLMGEVRTQVRTLALVDPAPGAVLRGLDACAELSGGDDLVTLFYGLLHRDGLLQAASAGHLPPLTCHGSEPSYLPVPPGLPLGVGAGPLAADPRSAVLEVRLEPGTGLVVFSDGLVETRERALTEGLDLALAHFRGVGRGSPAEVVEELLAQMSHGVEIDDDVTVLAVRLTTPDDQAHDDQAHDDRARKH